MHDSLRFAGRMALIAAGAHLLQFMVLGIGPLLQEPDYPDPTHAADNFWFGAAGSLTFTVIAIAYVLFFSSASSLVRNTEAGPPWPTVLQTAAGIGVGAWLLAGATNLVRRGFNATAIDAASGGDPAIGRAVLQGAHLTTSAAAFTGALAFGIWFTIFAIQGVRAKVFGGGTVAVCLFTAVTPVLGWLLNIGGVPVIIVGLLLLGATLLRRARKTAAVSAVVAQ